MSSFVEHLRSKLAPASTLLRPNEPGFDESLKRWSDLDVEIPLAIVQPASESDVLVSVREAIKAGIPVVPACGGHSTWSTVKDGLIIDLRNHKKVVVNEDQTATVTGGALMKDLQQTLSRAGRFTTVANGNTVGVIPYFINGGISIYSPLIGYASDNIISARLIDGEGKVQEVTKQQNPELLWGVRGAGQFFGLVLELTICTYPLSKISADGQRQLGMFFFTPDKAKEVCEAMKAIANDTKNVHAGHFMAVNAPPDYKNQTLLVAPQFFGTAEEFSLFCQPLIDIGPVQQMQMTSDFEHHSDHLDYIGAKGDFKRFLQIGVGSYDPEKFMEIIKLHAELSTECPDAVQSGYTLEWHTPTTSEPQFDTAFGMRDIQIWVNVLSWYHDAAIHQRITEYEAAVESAARKGTVEDDFVSYTNSHRGGPLKHRYKEVDAPSRLRRLKQQFDPNGVFTKELL